MTTIRAIFQWDNIPHGGSHGGTLRGTNLNIDVNINININYVVVDSMPTV